MVNYITVGSNTLVQPTISLTSGTLSFCDGDTSVLSSSAATNYLWSNSNITSSISVTSSGSYSVQISDSIGCISNSDTTVITVFSLPSINITAISDFCVNTAPLTLSGSLPAGGSYSGNGMTGNLFYPDSAGVGIHQINYSYVDINSCSNSDSTSVTVFSLPNVTISSFTSVCLNSASFSLGGGLPAGGNYSGDGVFGGVFYPDSAGIGIHQINYVYTDVNSCSSLDSTNITVDLCAGLNSINKEKIEIYPNPFIDEIVVSFPKNEEDVRINLTSQLGQIILQRKVSVVANEKITLSLPELSKGMYFFTMIFDNDQITKKMVTE